MSQHSTGTTPRVLTFGEMMLRLSPVEAQQTLLLSNQLKVDFAGAESTVANNLAHWGLNAAFATILPKQASGLAALRNLRSFGVDTGAIQLRPGQIGTFYIEYGASLRASKVLYDRAGSAFACGPAAAYQWRDLLDGSNYFFTTGITPALSEECRKATVAGLAMAKELGVSTCFDLNYRRSLWSRTAARQAFDEILSHIDVLIR